jgi:Cytochrome C oxidase, cbb3-type, subunit III
MTMLRSVKLMTKFLMLASVITGFSPCGFAEDINSGKVDYESHCAACHGKDGKGDGPVSMELRTKPADLTSLAKNNGDVFPGEVLYRIIDGRRTIRSHGTYEMPVWGFVFPNPVLRMLLETAFWGLSVI